MLKRRVILSLTSFFILCLTFPIHINAGDLLSGPMPIMDDAGMNADDTTHNADLIDINTDVIPEYDLGVINPEEEALDIPVIDGDGNDIMLAPRYRSIRLKIKVKNHKRRQPEIIVEGLKGTRRVHLGNGSTDEKGQAVLIYKQKLKPGRRVGDSHIIYVTARVRVNGTDLNSTIFLTIPAGSNPRTENVELTLPNP